MVRCKRQAERSSIEHIARKRPRTKSLLLPPDVDIPTAVGTLKPFRQHPRRHVSSTHGMHTRLATTKASINAVLNTRELLEMIFSYVPAEDLIQNVRRVSKTCNNVIGSTTSIRQNLFLSPKPLGDFWVLDRKYDILQPYRSGDAMRFGDEWLKRQSQSRPCVLNELLFCREKGAEEILLLHRARICESIRLIARPDLRKKGSIYHEMYLTQPPVQRVEFVLWFEPRKDIDIDPSLILSPYTAYGAKAPLMAKRFEVERPGGVKFKHILMEFFAKVPDMEGIGVSDWSLRIKNSSPVRKSVFWMLGASFVSQEEKEAVERKGKGEQVVEEKESDDVVQNMLIATP